MPEPVQGFRTSYGKFFDDLPEANYDEQRQNLANALYRDWDASVIIKCIDAHWQLIAAYVASIDQLGASRDEILKKYIQPRRGIELLVEEEENEGSYENPADVDIHPDYNGVQVGEGNSDPSWPTEAYPGLDDNEGRQDTT